MPIMRKGSHAIHFAHIPRTGGRALIQAFCRSGWTPDYKSQTTNRSHPHLYFEEVKGEALNISSFAVVRDPIDRFISACKFEGLCESQAAIVSMLSVQEDRPTVEQRHFQSQYKFIGPNTMIFKYEEDQEKLLDYMRFAGLVGHEDSISKVNHGAAIYEVNKKELGSDSIKIRRWYIDDYRRFGYIGSKT